MRYFDVPQNYQDEIGGNYYIQELKELLEALGKLRGKPVTDDELRASIAVYNENRRLVRELYEFRAEKPWQTPAAEVYLILRAGLVLPVEEHSALLRDYLAAAKAEERPRRDNCRVVVTGVFCEQPPLNLIKSLELAGCYVVDDDLLLVTRWLTGDVPVEGNPLENLALRLPAPLRIDGGQIRAEPGGEGPAPGARGQAHQCRGRDLRLPELLRSGAARSPDAPARAQGRQYPLYRVQIRGEFGTNAADPGTGRNLCRFNQAVERIMTVITTPKSAPAKSVVKDDSMVKQKEMMAHAF